MSENSLIMTDQKFRKILEIANNKSLSEDGGKHGMQGGNYQKAWALYRMFELEMEGVDDYFMLFETLQDVAEFDSDSDPKSVKIYQIKKKEKGEWKWNDLTGYKIPGKKSSEIQDHSKFKSSILGKLLCNFIAIEDLTKEAAFISNSKSDIPLKAGGSSASTKSCELRQLDNCYTEILKNGILLIDGNVNTDSILSSVFLKKTSVDPGEPESALIVKGLNFLESKSPDHARQVKPLIDTILATIGTLGGSTTKSTTIGVMKKERGYSRKDFLRDLHKLNSLPDTYSRFENIFEIYLKETGLGWEFRTEVRGIALSLLTDKLVGQSGELRIALITACDRWIKENKSTTSLIDYVNNASRDISLSGLVSPAHFLAQFLLRLAANERTQSEEIS